VQRDATKSVTKDVTGGDVPQGQPLGKHGGRKPLEGRCHLCGTKAPAFSYAKLPPGRGDREICNVCMEDVRAMPVLFGPPEVQA